MMHQPATMRHEPRRLSAVTAAGRRLLIPVLLLATATTARAADPVPGQLGLSEPANELARMMQDLHNLWLMPVVIVISLLVLGLLVYVCVRFNENANPTPSRTSHNTALEIVWTVVPVIILVILVAPSMRVLYATADFSGADMTIKITGRQWYWDYTYPEHGDFTFSSVMLPDGESTRRLMEVDYPMVIPKGRKIRLQVTSGDVLHNWAVSEFGVRIDATPGYLREVPLFPAERTGTFYGFCSELCGVGHSYMPIVVQVVEPEEFERWVEETRADLARRAPEHAPRVAAGN